MFLCCKCEWSRISSWRPWKSLAWECREEREREEREGRKGGGVEDVGKGEIQGRRGKERQGRRVKGKGERGKEGGEEEKFIGCGKRKCVESKRSSEREIDII